MQKSAKKPVTVAIMQPYLFPYLGYWQLFHAADHFVILDDVNFIKRGYINRNSILVNGEPFRFSIPLRAASQNKLIREIHLEGFDNNLRKTLRLNYSKAPYFDATMELVEELFADMNLPLHEFVGRTLFRIKTLLSQNCEIHYSSDIDPQAELSGQDRILHLTQLLSGHHYVNAIGGRMLYDKATFTQQGIQLSFLNSSPSNYDQGQPAFVPNLSILDVLMHNSIEQTRKLLEEYQLI